MSKEEQNIKIAVDAIVFGYADNTLQVLLIQQKYGKYKNQWALPGGFVLNKESLTKAVHRELKEETGIRVNYLEQLYTFGDNVKRDHRSQVVSVAYLGLANPSKVKLVAQTDALDAQWMDINSIPKLAFDHNKIIEVALERLQGKLSYQPIGFELLDPNFAFSQLEYLYMTILGRKLDRRNFRKKIMSFNLLEETGEKKQVGSGRPATLFKFNKKKYNELSKKGFHFEIKYA